MMELYGLIWEIPITTIGVMGTILNKQYLKLIKTTQFFTPVRGNKLQGLKSKDLIGTLDVGIRITQRWMGILGKILFGINQIQCPKV